MLTEAEELEMLELENENALAMRGPVKDAVDQPSGNTPPPNSSFEVEGRYNTQGATPSYAPPSTIDDGSGFSATRALLTNEPTQGIGEDFVRGAPAAVGGMIGTGAGMGVGSIPLAALGATGGEGLRQAAVGLRAIARGEDAPTTGQVLKNMGVQGATGAAGQAVGLAAGPVLKAVGRTAVNNPVSRAVGGYTKEAAERLMSHADDVVKNIGTADEMGGKTYKAAGAFKEAIRENMDAAGERYRQIINKVIGENPKYGPGFKLDLQTGMADDAAKVLRESGYGQPGRMADKADAEKFLGFWRKVNSMTDAGADDVYWLQRDLNNALGESNSPTLNRHLGKLKQSLTTYLDKRVPEIGKANKIYSRAAALADDLSRIEGADDASKAIISKYRALGSDTRQAIRAATKRIPEAQKALDDLLNIDAAKQFSKGMPDIPRTGFGAAALMGVNSFFNPAAVATAGLGAAGVSPLATAYGVKGVQAAGGLAGRAIPSWASKVAAPAASGYAGSRVGELLAPPQLSPNMQAVLQAAEARR